MFICLLIFPVWPSLHYWIYQRDSLPCIEHDLILRFVLFSVYTRLNDSPIPLLYSIWAVVNPNKNLTFIIAVKIRFNGNKEWTLFIV